MPKRGAATSATRRSRSFLLPVTRAWSGAAKPSAPASAGTSWTRPSVIMMTPATRSGGTSARLALSAREQAGAVGLGVRLAGLDHAHVEPGHAVQPLDDGGARRFGLPRAVAEILARALVDHDDGDGAKRIAVLAREGGVRQRQHDEGERDRAHDRAAAARGDQQQRQHRRDGGGRPREFRS